MKNFDLRQKYPPMSGKIKLDSVFDISQFRARQKKFDRSFNKTFFNESDYDAQM